MKRYLLILGLLAMICLPARAQYLCSSPGIICLPNDTTTAPVVNKLAKLSSAGLATVTGTTDLQGLVGVCLQNCALGGTGVFGYYGAFPLVVDATSTAQHWIVASGSVAGDGTDTGSATYPSTNNTQVVGQVVQASTGAASKSLVLLILRQPGLSLGSRARAISFTMGDVTNSSALTTSNKTYVTVPYACTISAWNLAIDAGTITVDIWKIASGTAIPTIANTITASALPAISSGTALHSTTLTGWTTAAAANDIWAAQVNTVATAKFVNLTVECDQ